jgi:hypothetical protein
MKPEGQAVSPAKVKPSVAPACFAAQAIACQAHGDGKASSVNLAALLAGVQYFNLTLDLEDPSHGDCLPPVVVI